ncbi:regulatory protein RecX [Desulfuromonas acetexigens]|uniref:Regulatory protein RecX n=1 Tax=Trichloromonas acetexigens TaxID=38815 RepID=A0A550J6I1_9BACT|nr:regulatory protein RecX [Desulfuromonas acetexigens]TRO78815.1 regulatory protein RecX [Desulfuromonas acetexigens]
MSATSPWNAALALLARRDRSEGELAARLRRKGFTEEEIAATLERCREYGYLDDARFARQRARSLVSNGRAVGGRLRAELKQQGIDEELARQAAEEVENDIDSDQLLAELLERRFPGFSYAEADDRRRRRVIHYFLRRGFSFERILVHCKNADT